VTGCAPAIELADSIPEQAAESLLGTADLPGWPSCGRKTVKPPVTGTVSPRWRLNRSFTGGLAVPLEEGSPEHVAATDALRRYWMDFGFEEAAGDYPYLQAV
jgi:hypothetical protein